MPGTEIQVVQNSGMDDIQLPPGYSFVSSDGRACAMAPVTPDGPEEPEVPANRTEP